MQSLLASVRRERGQVVMLAALLLPVLLGLVALSVDVGLLYAQRRQAQNAADESALAAARLLLEDSAATAAAGAIALEYAAANGYDHGIDSTVTVNIPPLSGEHVSDPQYVEVIVEEQPTSFFIHAVTPGAATVRARGVSGFELYPNPYGLVVLDQSSCEAFLQSGSANLTINNGGVMVNSDCQPNALRTSGSGDLTVGGSIDVRGGSELGGSGIVSPDPRSVSWTIDDPLAGTPPPSLGAAAPGSPGSAASPATWKHNGGDMTLSPGTYYGGFESNCACTITLQPGVYVMAGGGFGKAGGANFVGAGVMIYITENPTNSTGDGAPKPFDLAGSGALGLSPATSGLYQGITFWQDAAISADFQIRGNNSPAGGIFYVPGATMKVSGNTVLDGVQIIVNRFYIHGTTSITINYSDLEIQLPRVMLVE